MKSEPLPAGGRIASVEWLRIFAALCVMLAHFEALYFGEAFHFANAAVVVDFFFVLSGFLLMKGTKKTAALQGGAPAGLVASLRYAGRKARAFYPEYLLNFGMVFLLTGVFSGWFRGGEALARLWHFKWEALLLQMAGFVQSPAFGQDYLVGSAWYLSSLVLTMIPVYFLAVRLRRAYTNLIAPVAAVFIYSYIIQTYNTLDVGNEVLGFVMMGNVRAFAGLGLGCVVFALYDWARDLPWKKAARRAAAAVEAVCFVAVPALVALSGRIEQGDTLFWVPIFALLVFFCFSDRTPIARFLNRHAVAAAAYLGALSLYIYIFHWFFVLMFRGAFGGLPYWAGALCYGGSVLIFSALMMALFKKLRFLLSANKQRPASPPSKGA